MLCALNNDGKITKTHQEKALIYSISTRSTMTVLFQPTGLYERENRHAARVIRM